MPGTRRHRSGLLRNREYVGLLLSRIVSIVGDQLSRVALTVLVFERTASPALSAVTYAATFLPVVVGGPLLGGLADRLPRREVLVGADLVRAVLLALMAVPGLPIAVLIALLMLSVTVEAPWSAARQPLLRDVLVDDAGYQRGAGLDATLHQSGQILGFAGAGALLVVVRPGAALLLDAASFAVSAVLVRLLLRPRPAAARDEGRAHERRGWRRQGGRALADARTGVTAALAGPGRRPLLLTWAGVSWCIAPEALATPWATALGAGTLGVGLLLAAGPLGAVVGMTLVSRVSGPRSRQLQLPLALLTLVPLLLAVVAPTLPWALLLVVVSGVGSSYCLLARVAFMNALGEAHRGRAFAVAAAGVTAGQGVGVAAAGLLAALTGPGAAVTLCGAVGLVLVGLVGRLDVPAPPAVSPRATVRAAGPP